MLSSADAAVVRRDRALPGLATLLDADALVAALRACAPGMLLEMGKITYVRYKPGTSCLVGCRLRADGADVDVVARARQPWTPGKLAGGAVAGPLGPGCFQLEGEAAVVRVFPNDPKLDVLPQLADPGQRRQLLRKLLPGRPDLWDGEVQTLRYKPERRYVGRLSAAAGAQAVLKAYTPPGYEAAQRNAKAFRSRGPFRQAGRLGRSARHGLVALEWLTGRLLSEALAGPDSLCGEVRRVGATLAELHRQTSRHLPCRAREAEAAELLAVASWLGTVCPRLGRRAGDLARRLASRVAGLPPADRQLHGDFYAKQVLLREDGVAVLDFDEAVRGDPSHDLGLFLAHLEYDALRGRIRCGPVGPLGDALLDGYRAAARRPYPLHPELYAAAGLLRLAPHPFRNREADWPGRTAALLDTAEGFLARRPGACAAPAGRVP